MLVCFDYGSFTYLAVRLHLHLLRALWLSGIVLLVYKCMALRDDCYDR